MKQFWKKLTQLALTLHIYLSMTGFLLILLFAITGLTLNHTDSAFHSRSSDSKKISLPEDVVRNPDQEKVSSQLRTMLGMKAPVTLYKEFPDEIEVLFTAPGSRTHVVINRQDQTAAVEIESRGWLGKLEDLHKGHDAGRVWAWIIDIVAVLLATSAVTGIITLASLPGRRRVGFIFGGMGLLIVAVLYFVVPSS
jgi:hypothetical protein